MQRGKNCMSNSRTDGGNAAEERTVLSRWLFSVDEFGVFNS